MYNELFTIKPRTLSTSRMIFTTKLFRPDCKKPIVNKMHLCKFSKYAHKDDQNEPIVAAFSIGFHDIKTIKYKICCNTLFNFEIQSEEITKLKEIQ